ncbi:MarR family transcriptional regulator [Parapedobacter koreensis]|uniref:MarR family transcriptional regulator n=1 Tax=Parapedobacter koreensis TaxID=332977 RepID=UPI001FE21EA8|nr:helix-turn-helix domain-containing protein [Parapedobacter koreensis]
MFQFLAIRPTKNPEVQQTTDKHKYLGFLLQRGQMTAGELSNITGLFTGAVTSLIDRFEKQKLVKRQADKIDDKSKRIIR